VERCPTVGSGSGGCNYRSTQLALLVEGVHGVILTPDRSFLSAVNVRDNSVSSFGVGENGKLTLLDAKRTGNIVTGRGGTARSLAYAPSSRTLYVLHAFDHVRLMSVDHEGMLTARQARYSAAPSDKPDRVPTMVLPSPDEQFLLLGSVLDELPAANPDGSAIRWVQRNGRPHSIVSNAPDPDGLAVFPVGGDGALGDALFRDGGGARPFHPLLLNHRPNQFVLGYAFADGASLATLGSDGKVASGPVVPAVTSRGRPSELCWMTITPDDGLVFATMTGFGYITSWRLDGNILSIAKDPACPVMPGMAPSAGSAGSSAPARTTCGCRRTVPTCTRSTGTPRNWWATPSRQMAGSTRSPARPFRTTAPRVRLDSDAIGAWKYARSGPSPPSPRRAACPRPRAGCI
jgi:hypothetical protein